MEQESLADAKISARQ